MDEVPDIKIFGSLLAGNIYGFYTKILDGIL